MGTTLFLSTKYTKMQFLKIIKTIVKRKQSNNKTCQISFAWEVSVTDLVSHVVYVHARLLVMVVQFRLCSANKLEWFPKRFLFYYHGSTLSLVSHEPRGRISFLSCHSRGQLFLVTVTVGSPVFIVISLSVKTSAKISNKGRDFA